MASFDEKEDFFDNEEKKIIKDRRKYAKKEKRKNHCKIKESCRDITIIDFYLITTLLKKDFEKKASCDVTINQFYVV